MFDATISLNLKKISLNSTNPQVAWVFLASFSLYMFLALIPAMHSAYHLPLLVINGVIFGLHYAR